MHKKEIVEAVTVIETPPVCGSHSLFWIPKILLTITSLARCRWCRRLHRDSPRSPLPHHRLG
jgi:hypothetical protein